MPAPRWLARFNRHATNRLSKIFVARLRGFGVVIHRGRRSGRTYRTPVNVFSQHGGYVIALTYGADADWVRNVLAASQCELETRGKIMRLYAPHIVHDEQRRLMPPLVRAVLGIARVHDFMLLSLHPEAGDSGLRAP